MAHSVGTPMRRNRRVDLTLAPSRAAGPPALAAPERRATLADTAEALVAACLRGADGAAATLIETYRPIVRATITHYLASKRAPPDLADDLTHEVFLALLRDDARKLGTFGGRCSFAGWLRVVAVRLAIDALRRERHTVSIDDESAHAAALRRWMASDTPTPEALVSAAQMQRRLAAAVAALAPKDRAMVELHVLRGVSLPAVATTLGVSTNAAYVRKHRVLDRLRRVLREEES
jgi:RNA polymerase sigma-70 factor, ECF subfamily